MRIIFGLIRSPRDAGNLALANQCALSIYREKIRDLRLFIKANGFLNRGDFGEHVRRMLGGELPANLCTFDATSYARHYLAQTPFCPYCLMPEDSHFCCDEDFDFNAPELVDLP